MVTWHVWLKASHSSHHEYNLFLTYFWWNISLRPAPAGRELRVDRHLSGPFPSCFDCVQYLKCKKKCSSALLFLELVWSEPRINSVTIWTTVLASWRRCAIPYCPIVQDMTPSERKKWQRLIHKQQHLRDIWGLYPIIRAQAFCGVSCHENLE